MVCGAAELYAKLVLHLNGRYVYPLLDEFYPDFFPFTQTFAYLHTLRFFDTSVLHPFMYPAPVAMVYAAFFRASPHHALRCFLAVMLGCVGLAAVLLIRAMRARRQSAVTAAAFVSSVLLLSYPFWFVFRQGNMEVAVWVILSAGLFAFFHGRPYLAGVCFGVAISMKIFPFVYLGLLFARRQYRAIVLAVAVAGAVTVVSLRVVYPDLRVSWHEIQANLDHFRIMFMLHLRPERGFDHSLFGLYKQLAPTLPAPAALAPVLNRYLLVSAVLGVALYFLRIRKLPVINQLLCLTIASILLPPTSFDYTLIHLYAPWVLLVLYTLDHAGRLAPRPVPRALLPVLLCLAVLFAPLTELIYRGETLGGPIRCCVLILLFAMALSCPFEDTKALAGTTRTDVAHLA